MVTNGTKRDFPAYSLDQVRVLARDLNVAISAGVQNAIAGLGYQLEDVCKCLQVLEPSHFQHSIWYENQNNWFDVYHLLYTSPDGYDDNLYIKLRLARACLLVSVISFHRQR